MAIFSFFDTKATKRMREAIAEMESAVADKKTEEYYAETRLRETLKTAAKELPRLPLAGALVWRRRR